MKDTPAGRGLFKFIVIICSQVVQIMRRSNLSFFVSIVLAALLVAILLNAIWVGYAKEKRIERVFATVEVGFTKKDVVRELGAPDEIQFCGKPEAPDSINRECSEVYWYMRFISRWGFTFDRNGTVIHKVHNVSY